MRSIAYFVFLPLIPVGLAAVPLQQSDTPVVSHQESTPPPAPVPPPLTPGQERYLVGLKTAWRGVAQLKDGIAQVGRATGLRDTAKIHQAAHRLSGLCGAAHGFLVNGRYGMNANAFADSSRKPARDLAVRVDTLAVHARTCEHGATKNSSVTTDDLIARIREAEGALAAFRTSIGLPNKASTPPASLPPHTP